MGRALCLFGVLAVVVAAAVSSVAADGPYKPGGGDSRLDAASEAIQLGVPRRVIISTSEVIVEIPVVVRPVGISGTIESVGFADLAVNGVPFEVEHYDTKFDLPEKEAVELAAPLRLHARFASIAPGVIEQAIYPSEKLRLTGRATVAGTFRKWIFSVTRTIEIPLDVSRPNPVADYHPGKYLVEKLDGWLPRASWRSP
jgi:hypothetical protein